MHRSRYFHHLRAVIAVLAIGVASGGCVERLIFDSQCGDGRQSPGEFCLGEGGRFELVVDALTPLSLRVADFTGNGRPDILVTGTEDPVGVRAELWINEPAGFVGWIDPGVFGCSAHPVAGSIDGDAFADLIFDECDESVRVFRGQSSGAFIPAGVLPVGSATSSAQFVDVDADGVREVAVLGPRVQGDITLTVAEQVTESQFETVMSVVSVPGFMPSAFAVLDADAGAPPGVLLVAGGGSPSMSIAPALSNNTFGTPYSASDEVVDGATVRDLDGDGTQEVFALHFETETAIVFDFRDVVLERRVATVIPGLQPGPAALADFDGDDVLDLLRTEPGTANLQLWFGGEDGRFSDPSDIELDAPVDQLAVADFDLDGVLDLATGSFTDGTIRVLLSDP